MATNEVLDPKATDWSTEGCTIEAALNIVGDRQTFLILREILTGKRRFSEILDLTGLSRQVLSDRLARLLDHVARIQSDVLTPRGLHVSGMADRERRILSLVADGMDTREIADRLNYSERTVKNVLHDVTTRFQLRNRSQAVAYALREGLI